MTEKKQGPAGAGPSRNEQQPTNGRSGSNTTTNPPTQGTPPACERPRRDLRTRRDHTVIAFEHGGRRIVAGFGHFDTGKLAEVFITVDGKAGSEVAQHLENAAILVSLLLQHGITAATIRHSITGALAVALDLAEGGDQ